MILAPYAAHQIRDWRSDAMGLRWVKVVEQHDDGTNWDDAPRDVWTVRIIDRKTICVYDVRQKKGGGYDIREYPPISHGATDSNGRPCVPFRMFHPFPARDGTGRSNLRATAEADVSATRMLSELRWMLHMMCPILTLTTTREPAERDSIRLGESFVNYLLGKQGDREAEQLAYVQLDPTAANVLKAMYDTLCAKADEQANKNADVGVSGPVQQSGISKAWTFKTGEERVLFLISICLQEGFQWILETASRMANADPAQAAIKFPQSYDVTGIAEQTEIAEQIITLFTQWPGLNTVPLHVLEKIGMAAMGNPTGDELQRFKAELIALQSANLVPAAPIISQTVSARLPVSEGDTTGDSM